MKTKAGETFWRQLDESLPWDLCWVSNPNHKSNATSLGMKVKVFGASLIDFSPEVSATIKATATTDTSHLPRELKHPQTKRNRERNQRHRHITHPLGVHTYPDKIKCAWIAIGASQLRCTHWASTFYAKIYPKTNVRNMNSISKICNFAWVVLWWHIAHMGHKGNILLVDRGLYYL